MVSVVCVALFLALPTGCEMSNLVVVAGRGHLRFVR